MIDIQTAYHYLLIIVLGVFIFLGVLGIYGSINTIIRYYKGKSEHFKENN